MDFKEASVKVAKLSQRPENKDLLELYSYYKQGSEGDVQGQRPGMIDFKGRAKFDAWKKKEGLSQDEAKEKYIDLVQALIDKDS